MMRPKTKLEEVLEEIEDEEEGLLSGYCRRDASRANTGRHPEPADMQSHQMLDVFTHTHTTTANVVPVSGLSLAFGLGQGLRSLADYLSSRSIFILFSM